MEFTEKYIPKLENNIPRIPITNEMDDDVWEDPSDVSTSLEHFCKPKKKKKKKADDGDELQFGICCSSFH
jgi:hypothetical protein